MLQTLLYPLLAMFQISSARAEGVLVDNPAATQGNFFKYVEMVLGQNSWVVLTGAAVLVVASGVQYMLAVGNASNQTKAKERVFGVMLGLVFYGGIILILRLLSDRFFTGQ